MSWVIRDININLSTQDLNRAIREIEQLRQKILPAAMHLVEKLAEKGVEIAKAELIFFSPPAYYTGQLSDSITYEMENDDAIITAGNGCLDGEGNSYAVHVEYGTGIYNGNSKRGQEGWHYFNNRDGRVHWTNGMPPRPFMQNTLKDLTAEVEASGGKIIAEYLA